MKKKICMKKIMKNSLKNNIKNLTGIIYEIKNIITCI